MFGKLFGYFSKNWVIFSESSGHPAGDHNALALLDNIRLGLKGLPETNNVACYVSFCQRRKSFEILTAVVKCLKLHIFKSAAPGS